MIQRRIKIDGQEFLIRGNYKKRDLRKLYKEFVAKYGEIDFKVWAITRRKVYLRFPKS